jgi:hypothetical protein
MEDEHHMGKEHPMGEETKEHHMDIRSLWRTERWRKRSVSGKSSLERGAYIYGR